MAQHHDPSIVDDFLKAAGQDLARMKEQLIFDSLYENPATWIADLLELVERECREHNIREYNV